MTKITHAPQAVIDELSTIGSLTPSLVLDNIYKLKRFNNTRLWISHQHTGKQLAIINHVFGDERLQPERETRYIVTDGGGNFYLENGSLYIDSAESNDAKDYRGQGMTKEQADALVDNFGGSAVEIPETEREIRYYVEFEDTDGETVVYFMTDLGIVDYVQYDTVIIYEAGFSKQLAEAIVAEVGGEIKEIK